MRKVLKILHTIAACGMIGGIGCYLVLLLTASGETPAAYADLRQSIAAISNYVLLPSLGIGVVSGLLSMMVHRPFLNRGWVWLKAATGILMFKGVVTIVGDKANYAATVSRKIADGEPIGQVMDVAFAYEWQTLAVVMALSIANVVLGIWRPRRAQKTVRRTLESVPDSDTASSHEQRARPAA